MKTIFLLANKNIHYFTYVVKSFLLMKNCIKWLKIELVNIEKFPKQSDNHLTATSNILIA